MRRYIIILVALMSNWVAAEAQQVDRKAYVTLYNAIMRTTGALERERLYKELLERFGEYYQSLPNANKDVPIGAIAHSFIQEKDTLKANAYITQMSYLPNLPTQLYGMAKTAKGRGLNQYAEGLFKKAVQGFETLDVNLDPKADPLGLSKNPKKYGVLFYTEYASQLVENGKTKQGLEFAKKAYDLNSSDKIAITTYAKLLSENKMYSKALPIMEDGIRSGVTDSLLFANYKNAYLVIKGKKGFETQLASLQEQWRNQLNKDTQKMMISELAPNFTLKDLDGKTWSLAELKGKTVVLDFWATWCAPCKKSFPAMQMAVNKYKNDAAVVFLFIHTWERDQNATESAAKYIKDNKYSFNVLMDLKKNGQNEAITAYKADGIPAKYLIDRKGNIRFKMTGFTGSNEAALAELSTMIELCKKS